MSSKTGKYVRAFDLKGKTSLEAFNEIVFNDNPEAKSRYTFDEAGNVFDTEGKNVWITEQGVVRCLDADGYVVDLATEDAIFLYDELQVSRFESFEYDNQKYSFTEFGSAYDETGDSVFVTDSGIVWKFGEDGKPKPIEKLKEIPVDYGEAFDEELNFTDSETGSEDYVESAMDYDSVTEPVSSEPPIAWCRNGYGMGKSEVITYLQRLVAIQANKNECIRICNELNEEYRRSQMVPPEPEMGKPNMRIKKGIVVGVIAAIIAMFVPIGRFTTILAALAFAGSIFYFVVMPILTERDIYKKAVEQRNSEIARAEMDKIILKAQYEKIKELQVACQRKLDELYAVCVLKPKYQDMELVSCSYLLEVLVNGLSHTLERTEADPGAYYLFEEEMRNRNLIAKMDSMEKNIIQRMDQMMDMLAEHHMMMCEMLNEINNNVKAAVRELKQIKALTAVTAMSSMITARNTSQISQSVNMIKEHTAQTAFYSRCTALNTSNGLGQELRTRMGMGL